jgi:hypothetical protein
MSMLAMPWNEMVNFSWQVLKSINSQLHGPFQHLNVEFLGFDT